MSERLVFALAERSARQEARALVSEAAARASERGTALRDELAADRRTPLTSPELDAAFVPETYVGAADVFIDRALDLYRAAEHRLRKPHLRVGPRMVSWGRRAGSRAGAPRRLRSACRRPRVRARTSRASRRLWSGSLCVGMSVSVAVPSEPVLTSAGVEERPNGRPWTNTSALRTEKPRVSEMWILAVNAARERSGFGENATLSMMSCAGDLTSVASMDLPPEGSVTTLARRERGDHGGRRPRSPWRCRACSWPSRRGAASCRCRLRRARRSCSWHPRSPCTRRRSRHSATRRT